ncbi:MAG: hypothetical protein HN368_13145 [Spirochaetales bacterium]|nr:hypothetical protein [Spirochaetales bacterium]
MKKKFLIGTIALALFLATTAVATADTRVRLVFNAAEDFVQKPNLASVQGSFDDQANVFWGPSVEVVIDRLGFGMHSLVKFDRLPTGEDQQRYDWSLDWMGDFFAAYHLFGADTFIDPFFEVGFGNVGRVDIDDDQGRWIETSDGDWEYEYVFDPTTQPVSNLSLFAYVGAGVALNFDGLLLGARVNYRPMVIPVPATQFNDYPLTSFQVGLFAGVSLGGH